MENSGAERINLLIFDKLIINESFRKLLGFVVATSSDIRCSYAAAVAQGSTLRR